jgi:TonB family protein
VLRKRGLGFSSSSTTATDSSVALFPTGVFDGVVGGGERDAGRQKWLQLICLLLCIVAMPCQAQSDAANEWKRQIFFSLGLHKRFPFEARGRSGEASVGFTIDRTGRLISATILSGTGVPALDQAALQMVRSAQPFPPAPPDVTGSDLKFIAPVVFAPPSSSSS